MTTATVVPDDETRAPQAHQPHPLRWVALGLAVVAVAFLGVLATRKSAEQAASDSPLLGKPAPEVIGPGMDGSTIRLSQLRGRYVLVNFFASWCQPCANEHDDLLRFQEAHREAGDATVLAVTFNDELPDAKRFFERRGGDWPVVADERGKVSLDFGVRAPPESFLVSPEGIVLTRIIGEVRYDGLQELLRQAEAAPQ
ncbi:MAG TPA: TlpA disulfide reductase family protein [Acidimicrobiales bacterium]|nr:TlpA disulfide reductase family protein [Acidimicrobiales bacterium]